MCRLLGIIANKPICAKSYLEKFRNKFGKENPDGWGIGWYESEEPRIFKDGRSILEEESRFSELSEKVKSRIIIAHVRKSTGAPPSKVNSHPFQHKNWLFAHNGRVDKDHLLSILKENFKRERKGETDSEVYFYWILECIENSKDVINGIKRAIKEVLNYNYTGLNFLLSDGKRLYAFRYSIQSKKEYYSLWKLKRENKGVVLVCSEKLTEKEWKEINLGSLLIIEPDLTMREIPIV